ncbi:NADH-quinone oxidoreductase subunit C [Streptomyces cyslabdanicus]|uniref:NADH-quinone oxidoreductase subunit C n=1 Tax=Streptomyces cyslabdanicus TaxID=1470456 RepID=UPI0040444554
MSGAGWLPAPVEELFGTGATAEEAYAVLTVDVPPDTWVSALLTARDELGCTYFDWLSAVDEPGTGFRVSAHVVALAPVRRLLLRTTVPHEAPVLPTAVDVYAGAAWHERETHEMFGVSFQDHPALDHLLLPETFEGHPLRKDFVLAARVAKAWPGAKEPGEPAAGAAHGGPKRRQMLPPGVPDPNEWGPQKGQLPPAPSRPARGAARPAGDRPARRTRTAAEGSAGQTATSPTAPGPEQPAAPAARPRRMRSASEGSASQVAGRDEGATGPAEGSADRAAATPAAPGPEQPAAPAARPRRMRSASEGSASQVAGRDEGATGPAEGSADRAAATPAAPGPEQPTAPAARPRRMGSASEGSASQVVGRDEGAPGRADVAAAERAATTPQAAPEAGPPAEGAPEDAGRRNAASPKPSAAPRSSDAPWHHARPAFDESAPRSEDDEPDATEPPATPDEPEGGPR